jgi:hypothetical protein
MTRKLYGPSTIKTGLVDSTSIISQSSGGGGAVRRSGDALVDPLGEKKAPTELVTTNTNPIPVALRPAVSAVAPLAAQYGMFDVLGIDRCGVCPKIVGTVLSRPIKCQLSSALAI